MTGVQTCALPILGAPTAADRGTRLGGAESKRRRRPRLPAPPSRVTVLSTGRLPSGKLGTVQDLGRVLIGLGCLAVVLGAALLLAARLPWLGRLPGDIVVRRGPVTFYFPLLTCVVLSVVLTIVVNLFWRR